MKTYLIGLIIVLCLSSSAHADPVVFVDSYTKAVELSEKSDKVILAIFSSENCIYCSSLKNKIDSGDWDHLLEHKIVCYINTASEKELTIKNEVRMIPDSILIYRESSISRIKGYSPLEYRRWLKQNQ